MEFKLTKDMYRPNLNIKLLLSNAELLVNDATQCTYSCLDCPLASTSVKQEFGSICDSLGRMAEKQYPVKYEEAYRSMFSSLKIQVAKQFIELFDGYDKYVKINLTE